MNKKKFYIAEIIASVALIVFFAIGLFLPYNYRPDTTPTDALITTVGLKTLLVFDIFFMGYMIYDRARRIKNPRYDFILRTRKGGEMR